MRCLARARPKWSSSSVCRAAARSITRSSGSAQGISVIHSIQVRRVEASPAASCMRSSRCSSLRTWASTSGGMCAAVMASARLAISRAPSPFSPSAFLMVRNCSSSKMRRCRSSSCSLVRAPISRDRRNTSSRWVTIFNTVPKRSSVDSVSSRACFSGSSVSSRLAARSTSCEGERVPCSRCASSAGTPGSSDRISVPRSFSWIAMASACVECSPTSVRRSMRAARNGWPSTSSTIRMRCRPWHTACA